MSIYSHFMQANILNIEFDINRMCIDLVSVLICIDNIEYNAVNIKNVITNINSILYLYYTIIIVSIGIIVYNVVCIY